jgi:hypothetical protein
VNLDWHFSPLIAAVSMSEDQLEVLAMTIFDGEPRNSEVAVTG